MGPDSHDTTSDDAPDRSDAYARRGDLEHLAQSNADATWGETESIRARVPGILSGDVGPKGKVSAQMREASRTDRATYGDVPTGASAPHGFRLVLLPMLTIAAVLFGILALIFWGAR